MRKLFTVFKSRKKDKKCLKILGIGNSFTEDGTEYLFDVAKNSPDSDIIVGRTVIGGCSLDMHWNYIQNNEANYTFSIWYPTYKYDSEKKVTLEEGLKKEKWDVIVIQQVSNEAGDSETYSKLDSIIDYIKKYCPKAKIMWQMTWAYPQDSDHGGFSKYNCDQLTMYNAIVDTYKNTVSKRDAIEDVIPTGTAVQNLRTALGDTLNRDSLHLSYDYGRYTAALCWYKAITKRSIDEIYWVPEEYEFISENLEKIKQAVNTAIEKPFDITKIN